jgi:hypothetical protein
MHDVEYSNDGSGTSNKDSDKPCKLDKGLNSEDCSISRGFSDLAFPLSSIDCSDIDRVHILDEVDGRGTWTDHAT